MVRSALPVKDALLMSLEGEGISENTVVRLHWGKRWEHHALLALYLNSTLVLPAFEDTLERCLLRRGPLRHAPG